MIQIQIKFIYKLHLKTEGLAKVLYRKKRSVSKRDLKTAYYLQAMHSKVWEPQLKKLLLL